MPRAPIRAGILGTGTIATSPSGYLIGLMEMKDEVDTVAVADPVVERARSVAAQYGIPEVYASLEEMLEKSDIDLVINAPLGRESFYDEKSIRRAAIRYNIPCITTLAAAHAAARGIRALLDQSTEVAALQDLHKGRAAVSGSPAAGD